MTKCKQCDKEHNNKVFCSRGCHSKWTKGKSFEEKFGKNKSGKILNKRRITLNKIFGNDMNQTKSCKCCGKIMEIVDYCPSQFHRQSHCSVKCVGKMNGKLLKGETWEQWFGKEESDKRKIRYGKMVISLLNQPKYKEIYKKIGDSMRGKTNKEIFGTVIANKIKQKQKDAWLINKELRIKNVMKALRKRPTSYEQRFINLCAKHQLTYKYVGDGELIIGGKNPDFVNTNGLKILVETYWSEIHEKNYETKRFNHLKPYGFYTAFLSEHDLFHKDWENHCLNKIKDIENKWIVEHQKHEVVSYGAK